MLGLTWCDISRGRVIRTITFACIALAVASFQVHAATVVEAEVSLTNLNFAVTDLRPTDLIAPRFTLSSANQYQQLMAVGIGSDTPQRLALSGNLFDTGNGSIMSVDGVAKAAKSGRDQTVSTEVDESRFQSLPTSFFDLSTGGDRGIRTLSVLQNDSEWRLSPYTRLTITGTFTIDQKINGQSLAGLAELQADDTRILVLIADFQASLFASQIGGSGNPWYGSAISTGRSEQWVNSQGAWNTPFGGDVLTTEPFTLTVENNSGSSMLLSLNGYMQTSFSALPGSSIPEPGTWALMGLGLAGMAMIQRKKSV